VCSTGAVGNLQVWCAGTGLVATPILGSGHGLDLKNLLKNGRKKPSGENGTHGPLRRHSATAAGWLILMCLLLPGTAFAQAPAVSGISLTVNGPVAISPPTLPAATVGTPYSQIVSASGGTAPYTFAITTGALPSGLVLNTSTGVLSGTPVTFGTFSFTVRATDQAAASSSQAYTLAVLTVGAPSLAINPTSGTSLSGTTGTAFSRTFTASGGTAPYTFAPLTISSGTMPTGLSFSTSTGTLSGTPTAAGTVNFTVKATDSSTGTGAPFSISGSYTLTVTAQTTSVALASSLDPSLVGQSVTFTATVSASSATPTGAVTFKDGVATLGSGTLTGGVATLTTAALTGGPHTITALYNGDINFSAGTSPALTQTVNAAPATTASLASSVNPSAPGQAVTFTATVTSAGGTPTGTVTFKDGAAAIGSATLAGGGVAALTISSLTLGSHSITAVYGGSALFATSTSAALIQAVSTPADSLKLRAMQALAAPVVAQNSGAAISGAIDAAISEGFGGGGALVTPSGSGVRFNFAADPDGKPADGVAPRSTDPFSSANGSFASTGHGFAAQPSPGDTNSSTSRVDDAFGALAFASPTKAPPPRYVEQRDWLGWAEVRGAVLDHWGSGTGASGTVPGASMLYGSQVNLIAGLTRRLTPNFLVGVLGGYETFDYRSDALQGRLKGDGWTVGSYLGWRITQSIRFDAAVAYSGIGYNGTAGTASGNFGGDRWMVSSGLTGTYQGYGLQIEPSARIYALWERENAYTDSLGTLQAERDFSTGRASGGLKVAYPITWSSTVALAPYLGLYGDYYFNSDNATAAVAASGLPGAVVLDGFSARAIGGVTAKFANGGQISLGTEFGGIGGNASIWIYRARASVPF
jgi:Bacterial Ig-like domain (group 3)/Autotransporter beta-domain/Putative Ig domain